MDDGYLLYITIDWGQASVNSVDIPGNPSTMRLLDTNGQELLFERVYDDGNTGIFVDKRQTVIAVKTAPIQVAGPLMLTVDSFLVDVYVDASFSFDPGLEPKPDQVWSNMTCMPLISMAPICAA